MFWITLLIIFLVLCGLYVLSTMGRRNHDGMDELARWSYAHRGLHGKTRPENSMSAFRAALKAGYGAELDVHLLADGNLAVIHDSDLRRTTGSEGRVEDLTTADLKKYCLEDTLESIPTLSQVLDLFDGQAPLIIELKTVDNNYATLTQTVCKLLVTYNGPFCIESSDPRCIFWLRKNRPELIRGQLAENFLSANSDRSWFLRFAMTHQMLNFLTFPDFVAYRYHDRFTVSNLLVRNVWGVQGVSWTIRNKHEYFNAIDEEWIPIFENFEP